MSNSKANGGEASSKTAEFDALVLKAVHAIAKTKRASTSLKVRFQMLDVSAPLPDSRKFLSALRRLEKAGKVVRVPAWTRHLNFMPVIPESPPGVSTPAMARGSTPDWQVGK